MRGDGSNEFRTWRVRCVVADRPRDFPEGTAAARSGTERVELDEHAEPVFDVTGARDRSVTHDEVVHAVEFDPPPVGRNHSPQVADLRPAHPPDAGHAIAV